MRAHEGVPVVSSRDVAERFGKRHADVLRDIEAILTNADLRSSNWFIETAYVDAKGETRRAFDLTRQAFTLLVMGWTGEKAMDTKNPAAGLDVAAGQGCLGLVGRDPWIACHERRRLEKVPLNLGCDKIKLKRNKSCDLGPPSDFG